jgi:hypothetical protein
MEWAGAFGDLGTLIPFVVAYIGVLKMDPMGVLFAFGVAMIVSGSYYKTPFPVQPMKAAGAVAITQAAQTAVITPTTVYAASLTTGIIWLILGLTGAIGWIAKVVSRPVVIGIILGLGMSFMLEGIKMMADNWLIGGAALVGTLLLLSSRSFPAMFLLLFFGAVCGLIQNPGLLNEFTTVHLASRLPTLALTSISWHDLLIGTAFLALPQLPLTLGNAVIVTTEENNQLFPDRPVTVKAVSTSTGLLNLFGASVGGVPMCHGAGGMAGHVRFGAKDRGRIDYPWKPSSLFCPLFQHIGRGHPQGIPSVGSRGDSLPDRGSTRFGLVRLWERQARSVYLARYGWFRYVECRISIYRGYAVLLFEATANVEVMTRHRADAHK